ncbi:MAG TPA: hypothetical protein VMT63_08120 [Bacteroidales bacterium]|nr:hypothetical protein [Bacteroidales bacterium]
MDKPKDPKPDTPLTLGTIRAYFGNYYKIFDVGGTTPYADTASNCYFHNACTLKEIDMIRNDTQYTLGIYIVGYPPDVFKSDTTITKEAGKYSELHFFSPDAPGTNSKGHYVMYGLYSDCLIVSDNTGDVLTGTFSGTMQDYAGNTVQVTEGEFKIHIYRKTLSCNIPQTK